MYVAVRCSPKHEEGEDGESQADQRERHAYDADDLQGKLSLLVNHAPRAEPNVLQDRGKGNGQLRTTEAVCTVLQLVSSKQNPNTALLQYDQAPK